MIAVSLTAGTQLQAQDNTAQSADISAKAKTYIDALNLGNTEKQQQLEKV